MPFIACYVFTKASSTARFYDRSLAGVNCFGATVVAATANKEYNLKTALLNATTSGVIGKLFKYTKKKIIVTTSSCRSVHLSRLLSRLLGLPPTVYDPVNFLFVPTFF